MHLVVTSDHEGLKKAVAGVLPTALWQRCYVHFLRNALDHLPRSAERACLQELRWLYDRHEATEARTGCRPRITNTSNRQSLGTTELGA